MRAGFFILLLGAPVLAQTSPTVITDVTDKLPAMIEHAGDVARWADEVVRDNTVVKCGTPLTACTAAALIVANRMDKPLTCGGALEFEQPNAHGIQNASAKGVIIPPGARRMVVQWVTPLEMKLKFSSSCIPIETTAPALPATAIVDCSYTITRAPDVEKFYPPAARAEDRQGKIFLEFTLAEPEGRATNIVVYQTSSHADLDAAGVVALGFAKFKTNCEGRRYRAAIRFSIRKDQASARSPPT